MSASDERRSKLVVLSNTAVTAHADWRWPSGSRHCTPSTVRELAVREPLALALDNVTLGEPGSSVHFG